MCDADFYNAQCKNREIEAKLRARLEAIHQKERQAYGLPSEYDTPFQNEDIAYIVKAQDESQWRLSKLEERIGNIEVKLNKLEKEIYKTGTLSGDPFIRHNKDGKPKPSNMVVTLSSDQIRSLLKSLNK